MDDLTTRAAIAGGLLLVFALLGAAGRGLASRQRSRVLSSPPDQALATGGPAILYFHGDQCGDCLTQERELDALLAAHPEVAIRADHAPSALSKRFGVLTVPTTVVLDGAGGARAVNYGLTGSARLAAQLAEVGTLRETA